MTRDPLFLRVDATLEGGYERLARALVLAAAMQRRRRPVHFLSRLEPTTTLLSSIKRGGNHWIPMSHPVGTPEDASEMMQHLRSLHPAAVLVDDAGADRDYLTELSNEVPLLASMDHQAMVRFPSKLVINPLLGPSRDSYEHAPNAQLLLGRRYAMVRPEVRRNRPIRSQEPPPLAANDGQKISGQFRALLALGEDDPNRQVMELTKQLINTPRIGKVDIIVRREHPDLPAIREMVEANKDQLELALEPAEIAARITRCHFALTSGSGWSLELACVGVPQLLLLQNEHHWPNAQRLEEEGCASVLGWHENVSPMTIRDAVHNLLTDPLERQAMARCGRQLIDGRGPDRLVNAIEIMLVPARSTETIRIAA